MSYWFGLITHGFAIACIDRALIRYPGDTIRTDIPKYYQPQRIKNLYVLPAGSSEFATKVGDFFANFCVDDDDSFNIERLTENPPRKTNFENIVRRQFELLGGLSNSTILFAGFSNGKPFLGEISNRNNFNFQCVSNPGSFILVRRDPEINNHVTRRIRLFTKWARGKGLIGPEKWMAKRIFPGILRYVSVRDGFTSPEGDLIFITRDGSEIVSFARNGKLCPH